jgi:DNA-binding Xre family transcriptional regulator
MKWNLRLVAANRGIWKASDLQRMLADHGLVISSGKMSNLWSGDPITIRKDDLNVICVVLDCTPNDLLEIQPEKVTAPNTATSDEHVAVGQVRAITPRPRTGRSLPPR